MIVCDGYSIEQYPLQNRVVIALPQTVYTVQETNTMPQNRRVELTSSELTAILVAIKWMYEMGGEKRMTAKEMIDVMLKLPEGCRITSDSGWECDETDICEVWYSTTKNEARLTQDHYRGETLGFNLIWKGEEG